MSTEQTTTNQLMDDAARADLALDDRGDEFMRASRELVMTRRNIDRLRGVPSWLAACDEHGGPDEALAAIRAEIEQAREYLARLEAIHREMPLLRARLGKGLADVDAKLFDEAMVLTRRAALLEAQLKGAENSREVNVHRMVELGAEEATARSIAKPHLGEIAAMRVELAGIPELQAENARLLNSYVERARLAGAAA